MPEDEESCAALLAELGSAIRADPDPRFSDVFKSLVSKQRGQVVVADEDGTVLGMATVSFNLALRYRGEYCQLEELIVSPRARGRNLGGLYLLESTEHNRPFYAKYGFEGVGSEMRQRLNP